MIPISLDTTADHHMHSYYSDGNSSIADLAEAAILKGLKQITITDHMPLPFQTRYAMEIDALGSYREEILRTREQYAGQIQILMGMEIEYIPEFKLWIEPIAKLEWDVLIASIHSIVVDGTHFMVNGNISELTKTVNQCFGNDIKAYCRTYYRQLMEAIETGWFDIVGHMDVLKKHSENNILFDDGDAWYRQMIFQVLDVVKESGMKVEINTAGLIHPVKAPYPAPWIIDECITRGIPLVLSSDSHRPETLGQYFEFFAKISPPATAVNGATVTSPKLPINVLTTSAET